MEELFIEYLEDMIEEDPTEAYPRHPDDVHVALLTKDSVVNQWERQIAAGDTPDFLSVFSEEERAKIERFMKRKLQTDAAPVQVESSHEAETLDDIEEFSDNYEAE